MIRSIKTSTRLALTIGMIFVGVFWIAAGLRIVPNPQESVVPARVRICETLAISTSTLAETDSGEQIQRILTDTRIRNPEIVSIGLRGTDGEILFKSGAHETWLPLESEISNSNQMFVTLSRSQRKWADLEIQFRPINSSGTWFANQFPLPAMLFCGAAGILLVWLYLARILKHLDPSKVVPTRVRTAFDSLAAGLMLTDPNNRIVLANDAFKKSIAEHLIDPNGFDPSEFTWKSAEEDDADASDETVYPWVEAYQQSKELRGAMLTLVNPRGVERKFVVNATPVFGEKNKVRGVLTSFDDVTVLEQKQHQLVKTLKVLHRSRDEIKRQNKELQVLASIDPLSGCLNRRAFFEKFLALWNRGDRLSTIMVDIDHFKKVNDTHGHAVGDSFIRATGEIMRSIVGDRGLVCRYGGEEFCVALLDPTTDEALRIAWAINRTISQTFVEDLPYTASVGVAVRDSNSSSTEELLDQADKSLYVAKRNGRNRVVAWHEVTPEDMAETNDEDTASAGNTIGQNDIDRGAAAASALINGDTEGRVSETTINSLLTALAFRDRCTAEHSRRVANVCVEVARGIVEDDEIADIETGALLHDIGKIGVPDSILLKAGPLTDDEWKIMSQHDEMSHSIVKSSGANDQITEMVEAHHTRFEGNDNQNMPSLGARILSACDAFDAMTNNRVYRKRMTVKEAFAELRRSAPRQFDPTVVELLIDSVSRNPDCIQAKSLEDIAPVSNGQLESQILRLQMAIGDGETEQFPTLLHQLVTLSIASNPDPMLQSATDRLQTALEGSDQEIENLLALTQDILDISKSAQASEIAQAHQTDLQSVLK